MDDLQVYRDALAKNGGNAKESAAKYIAESEWDDVDIPKFCMALKNRLLYERLSEHEKRLTREVIRQLGG